ncbi:hypothetical protein C1H46_027400 [Malus baccata]|uniref:Uncharacterized protein n=1 Tax=Malus baccata TaxID=106549 RepID=A0A540LKK8_MALBA|nr:hypothetical protein C1H46_027400 [Malus baccata]
MSVSVARRHEPRDTTPLPTRKFLSNNVSPSSANITNRDTINQRQSLKDNLKYTLRQLFPIHIRKLLLLPPFISPSIHQSSMTLQIANNSVNTT